MNYLDWRHYVDDQGNFELGNYLYRTINTLMKQSLDLGVLLSNDPAKLRAYKESVKGTFKKRWLDVAQALESFDIIVPCGCPHDEFCRVCGGSRYRLNSALSPDQIREISTITGVAGDLETAKKLEQGLKKALDEVGHNA